MRKILCSIVIGMTAGLVMAQDTVVVQEKASDVSVSADVALYSAYVWRGVIINDNMVAQPSVTAAKGPFSLNVWGNWNAITRYDGDDDTEVDYTAAYTLPLNTDVVTMDVGMIYYTYPGSGAGAKSTEEVFLKSTFNNILLTPVATVYYDIDQVNGWYGNLALSHGVEICDALSAEIGGSIGYGTRSYNQVVWGEDTGSGAVNDYNVYVSTDYALTEDLSLGALLQYTRLDGGVGNDVAGVQNNDILWGGVTLSYKFL
jgi:uncharacterized protein (TIGR02001 family)